MPFRFRYTLLTALALLILTILPTYSSSSEGFYTLSISTQGGHLGKGKIYITVNDKPMNIYGDMFIKISEFSGAISFPINSYVIKGKNKIEFRLVKSNKPNPKFTKSTAIIQLNLSYIKKNQMVDTSTQGALFSRKLTIKAGEVLKPVSITFVATEFDTPAAISTTQTLKITGKIDKASIAHAKKLALLYSKLRTAYMNYDVKFILANSFMRNTGRIPPRKRLAQKTKDFLPDIYTLTLVKVERKGKVTGLWMLPLKKRGDAKTAYLLRFLKDEKGHWRSHLNSIEFKDSLDPKKSAMSLLNELKL